MVYVVELNNHRELKVELDEADHGQWRATVDGDDEVELRLKGRDEDGAFVLMVDGKERRFHLDRDATRQYLTDDRDMARVDVDPAGEVVIEHGETERRGELDLGTLESPMTGVLLDVFVEEGDEVQEGQEVAVIEAMKMENTLSAPIEGTVEELRADEGDRVRTGDDILHVEAT
jgi:biotin carboxyl carrier protein